MGWRYGTLLRDGRLGLAVHWGAVRWGYGSLSGLGAVPLNRRSGPGPAGEGVA